MALPSYSQELFSFDSVRVWCACLDFIERASTVGASSRVAQIRKCVSGGCFREEEKKSREVKLELSVVILGGDKLSSVKRAPRVRKWFKNEQREKKNPPRGNHGDLSA